MYQNQNISESMSPNVNSEITKQDMGEITVCLRRWEDQDPSALHELMPLVYQRLRAISYGYIGKKKNNTLQPTALINEVYLELQTREGLHFPTRAEFFAFSGFLMRRVLSRYARERQAQKRGGDCLTVAFEHEDISASAALSPNDLLSLDRALERLERIDPRKCRLVEMRFYAGLDLDEIAEVLEVSTRTLKRDWQAAKRILAMELSGKLAIAN